jgi:DUF4097 and DUF4098 domain-containing protein YvlB
MAAAPPPYSPRDARRQARDYARAQRDQARAQRQYWRAYYGYRRTSITGPVILLTVGIMALLIETGHLSGYAVWDWYGRWWPLLLIGIGLISLAEYFWDRNNPYAGRRSAGGIVFLILLFAFLGWGGHNAHNWGPIGEQFGNNGDDFFSMLGEEHDNDVQMDQALAANATVNIQNSRGDVTVTASSDGQMHLRAHQIVHTNSDDNAQKIFQTVKPRIDSSASGAVITVPGKNGARVDLTLELPEKSFATINTAHGDVTVEGLQNNVDVTNSHGDAKFDNIGGDVHARMDHGDVSAHQVMGHAFVDGHADDVTLSEIKGQVILDGEFFGDTHLEQIGSTVHFHTSRTDLDIPRLGGDLTMDSSDLTASQIAGPVRIVTRSKNIDLSQVAGDVHIENSDGDVNVGAAVPLGNVQISNRSGGLTLTVPENASFSITATTTEDDDLETDFPLQTSTSGDRRTLEGTVGGGGVKLELTTSHGNLELKKGSSLPLPPPAPPAPSAPKAPGAQPRHLKAPKGPTPEPTAQ